MAAGYAGTARRQPHLARLLPLLTIGRNHPRLASKNAVPVELVEAIIDGWRSHSHTQVLSQTFTRVCQRSGMRRTTPRSIGA